VFLLLKNKKKKKIEIAIIFIKKIKITNRPTI